MTEEDRDTAGRSADREHQRRKAKDQAKLRTEWGKLGGLAVALTPEKQSTRAWSSGAAGEAAVGARLDRLASASIRVMHDRRVPRSKANIDHIVVTRGGVWVIDTKRYVGRAPEKRVEGGIIRPRVELLMVKGRDKTALVDAMHRQVELVEDVVGNVPVRGVLCFVDAEWSLLADPFEVNGVKVAWPKKVADWIQRDGDAGVDVDGTARVIAQVFKPA